ncbi:hypothetical protein NMNIID777_14140 [Neisseria meningitidis]|nr:hypothetical protein NMNIID777_14140 [Neisseria meningitidis]
MSDKFNQFINRVLSHEGGYANHPKDPGGETNWGITKRTAQANGYNGSMRAMTREQAIRDLCKIPFPPDSRNPNTGFQLFSPQIPPNSTQIPP